MGNSRYNFKWEQSQHNENPDVLLMPYIQERASNQQCRTPNSKNIRIDCASAVAAELSKSA